MRGFPYNLAVANPQKKPQADGKNSQIEALKKELAMYRDLAARAQADLQNAKARVEKDRAEVGKFATEALIVRLLPTIENFQRAFQHLPDELKKNEWVKGITAVEQELMRQMADVGLTRMHSLGQPIDPQRHEALLTGPGEAGKVIEVLEEGYELHGKPLRTAKVKVGQ